LSYLLIFISIAPQTVKMRLRRSVKVLIDRAYNTFCQWFAVNMFLYCAVFEILSFVAGPPRAKYAMLANAGPSSVHFPSVVISRKLRKIDP